MRSIWLVRFAAALLMLGLARWAGAADAAFVGKLALVADPEVAKELGLTDDVKKKLMDLINEREQEAIGVVAKLKGQPQAKQAAALAPFVAESEKRGIALLTDDQVAKLNKLRVAKEGMMGVLAPDVAQKLQLTPDQAKDIGDLLQQHKTQVASANDFQKRSARQIYERKIAGVLNDAQRGTWEQLSGVPAGGSAAGQSSTPAAPPGPGGSAPSGPGGVNVQRAAGAAELAVTEDGKMSFKFEFTPWRNVLEYFARKGGYAFATDKWPPGTFNYSDTRTYTPEQAIDVLNMHLLTKGFILVKREKLLRLFDTANDGPVPPEFVPEVSPQDLINRGEFELVTATFQLDRWPPSEAEAEIKKRLGPYGSITVLSTARQLVVTDLGGKLRWIKRTIDAVEQPDAPKDEKFAIIHLNRLTPTEFLTTVRQLFGIPEGQFATTDGALRLSINELDGVVYCHGKGPKIEQVQELAKQIENAGPTRGGGPGGIAIVEQPQYGSYQLMHADPTHVENVIRTLLAGSAPDLKVQLDPKSGKMSVWGRASSHLAIQAIIREMENQANTLEVIRLRKLNVNDAMTSINQLVGNDPSGKGSTNGLRVSADPISSTITLSGTPAQVEAAKDWLVKMGENIGGGSGSGGRMPGMPEDRSPVRVLPLSSRTVKHVLDQLPYMWNEGRAKVHIEHTNTRSSAADDAAGSQAATPRRSATTPKAKASPKSDATPMPQPQRPAIPLPKRDDVTRRPLSKGSRLDLLERQATLFVSEPPAESDAAAVDVAEAEQAPAQEATPPAAEPPAGGAREAGNAKSQEAPAPAAPASTENAPAEITVRVTPGGIIISSQDLDALDDFQNMLQELVQMDERRGKRTETFPLRYKDADVAAAMLKAMMDGGASVGDTGLGGFANMLGGGMGGLMGSLLGGGGGGATSSSTVNSTASGTPANITPDVTLNVLYVTALPRDLDNIEQLIELIDKEESSDPPAARKTRFIPVLHGKAETVLQIVREQFAGQIYGEQTNRPQQIQPQDVALALLTGGRGGGPRGGGPGGRGNQQNLGEKPKMMISVATDTNALIVTAPDHLFQQVEDFVHMLDLENVVPDATVRVVNLRRTNSDSAFLALGSMLGTNATITRVLPVTAQPATGARGGQNNQQMVRNNQQGGQQGGQQGQLNPQALQQLQAFNQGQGGRGGGRGGGPGGQGGGPAVFIGPGGGFGGGNFGGGNFGRGGGGPGGFGGGGGGNNFGGRGGGGQGGFGGGPGGGGGGNFGGRGGGGGGGGAGAGGGNFGGRGGGGIQ